jgi:hypothetical protein
MNLSGHRRVRQTASESPTRQLLASSFGFCAIEFLVGVRLDEELRNLIGVTTKQCESLIQIRLWFLRHDQSLFALLWVAMPPVCLAKTENAQLGTQYVVKQRSSSVISPRVRNDVKSLVTNFGLCRDFF